MDPVYLYRSLSCAHQLSLLHLKPAGNPGQRVGEDQSRPFYPQTLKNTTSVFHLNFSQNEPCWLNFQRASEKTRQILMN